MWSIAALANLTKPIHIDDTVYLEDARWIRANPLRPMSGTVHWGDHPEPVHAQNQPLLIPYFLAIASATLGESEVMLHLAHSAFSLMAAVLFYLMARGIAPENAVLLTTLFVLGPHFVPSQNLMTDVPMTAFWLGALYAHWARPSRPILGGLWTGAALLTKYTSLVLGFVLVLHGILCRNRAAILSVSVAAGMLVTWCVFNYFDYGGIHILQRPVLGVARPPLPNRAVAWLICLGAISPFSVLGLPVILKSRAGRWALLLVALTTLAAITWGTMGLGFGWGRALLRGLFVGNGVFAVASLALVLVQWRHDAADDIRWSLLGATAAGLAVFTIVLAPFMATRHVMPVVAVFLLCMSRAHAGGMPKGLRVIALTATLGLSTALTLADYAYADVYRKAATNQLGVSRNATTYFVGHWGWQWYATRSGMIAYESGETNLREGDLLIVPRYIAQQTVGEQDQARLLLVQTVPGTVAWDLRVRTMVSQRPGRQATGYYASDALVLPWVFDSGPVEEFAIFRCCVSSGAP